MAEGCGKWNCEGWLHNLSYDTLANPASPLQAATTLPKHLQLSALTYRKNLVASAVY